MKGLSELIISYKNLFSAQVLYACCFLEDKASVSLLIGAGVSVAAGLSTFQNIREDPDLRHLSEGLKYRANDGSQILLNQKTMVHFRDQLSRALPTKFHRWIWDLTNNGTLDICITQNVDLLEVDWTSAGNAQSVMDTAKIIPVHGSAWTVRCQRNIHFQRFTTELLKKMKQSLACNDLSYCSVCSDVSTSNRTTPLLPGYQLYGEMGVFNTDMADLKLYESENQNQIAIVAGTQLKGNVVGAKQVFKNMTKTPGGKNVLLLWVNPSPPPADLTGPNVIHVKLKADEFAESVQVITNEEGFLEDELNIFKPLQ